MGMGIAVQRHFIIAWALAGLAAVIGGTLWGQVFGFGFSLGLLGLKVFPIVIIGGLESIVGVIVGGLSIGVLERLAAGTMESIIGSGSGNFIPYIVMIIVLMIRPYGIFGVPDVQRV
jgi:branched-chain amino acid transport system permease protein